MRWGKVPANFSKVLTLRITVTLLGDQSPRRLQDHVYLPLRSYVLEPLSKVLLRWCEVTGSVNRHPVKFRCGPVHEFPLCIDFPNAPCGNSKCSSDLVIPTPILRQRPHAAIPLFSQNPIFSKLLWRRSPQLMSEQILSYWHPHGMQCGLTPLP